MPAASVAVENGARTSALPQFGSSCSDLWWLRPHDLIIRFILPFFLITSWFGSGSMQHFGAVEFIGSKSTLMGAACLLMLAAGSWLGQDLQSSVGRAPIVLDRHRTILALWGLGLVAIAAHIILVSGLLATRGELLTGLFKLQHGAAFDYGHGTNPNRVAGLTTLTQVALIFFAIFGAYRNIFGIGPPRTIQAMAAAIIFLVIMRSFLGSERIALIEVLAVWGLANVGLRRRDRWPMTWQFAPLWGALGVFFLFAAAEYFRSWSFYFAQYESYIEFAFNRFFGYFATATNNGFGTYETFGTTGLPFRTALWFYKFPLWSILGVSVSMPADLSFLSRFANPEFNSPSGIFAPIIDFGFLIGILLWTLFGIFSGYLYVLFCRALPLGVILYPSWLFGFFDIIRIFYWGEPRFIPVMLLALPTALFVRARLRRAS